MQRPEGEKPGAVSEEEWAKRLTPEQFEVARRKGTEAPFTGKYYTHKEEGTYNCVCCGAELFSSETKYDSGSGWPSFYKAHPASSSDQPDGNVMRQSDVSHGMVRTEVICKECNAHLGHVFPDGPAPTGERFCVNSVCLKFTPKKMTH